MVDKIPERGNLGLIDSLKLYTGSCAMNACVDMKKLGANAALVGMVGNDGFGSFMVNELKRLGMPTEGIKRSDDCETSASVVLVDGGGERTFVHSLGANGKFTDSDVNYDVINDSKVVFIAGTMLMPAFAGDSFCSGFLYGLTHGMTMTESAQFANAVATHCVLWKLALLPVLNPTKKLNSLWQLISPVNPS